MSTRHPLPEVKVGQVWADNDKRSAGRTLEVISINTSVHEPYVTAKVLTPSHGSVGRHVGKYVYIRLRRFKPNSTGYRLVTDVEQ